MYLVYTHARICKDLLELHTAEGTQNASTPLGLLFLGAGRAVLPASRQTGSPREAATRLRRIRTKRSLANA